MKIILIKEAEFFAYSILEKFFPNVFNKRVRQQVFGSNPWMLDMYNFLIGYQTLEEANKDFDEMSNIIKTIIFAMCK